jgi:uridine kinase
MQDTIQVRYTGGTAVTLPYGTRISDFFSQLKDFNKDRAPVIGALVNNKLTSLSYQLEVDCDIFPVRIDEEKGRQMYRRSLSFLLALAAYQLFPGKRLIIGHSLGNGYYYYFENYPEMAERDAWRLQEKMKELVAADLPINRRILGYCDALDHFKKHGMTDTALLLEHMNDAEIAVYQCKDIYDLAYEPLAPSTGILQWFEIRNHPPGFILRYPSSKDAFSIQPFTHSPLLFSIYQEYKEWGKILSVNCVGRLNELTSTGKIRDFIRVAEALHEKKIAQISDKIKASGTECRIVLIAGPSSSGKTTFTKKLAIQLRTLGFIPHIISLDDYFLPREETPKDEAGNYDFESLYAIDIALLNNNLTDLFKEKEVEIPSFNFKTGSRKWNGNRIHLQDRTIILMEGIHGLNEKLTPEIRPEQKYKIYVSALTQLNLDDHNRISTTDNRLIRRIVRDYQFRGHNALATLEMWPSVRRGENRNIFPFQDSADIAFNSALDYELGVLKSYAVPLLRSVKPFHSAYSEAMRISAFLENFITISDREIPEHSILREFIGESSFEY